MRSNGKPVSVVTGAFGFSGHYIAQRLLARGHRVRTLTNHANPAAPAFRTIEIRPLRFADPDELERSLEGAQVLYNTYWVRFAHGGVDHAAAVTNTLTLLRAAERAGIRRIVHVSITNPSLNSPLPYFRGKAEVEQAIRSCALEYTILRPAVLFGPEDILINNIAWLLRRAPLFAIPPGRCGIQPIHADDLAALAIELGENGAGNSIVDAVGPETYAYRDLVHLIRDTVRSHAAIIETPPWLLMGASRLLSRVLHDVVLTRDEISGLVANLLVSEQPPTGVTSLRSWLEQNADSVGRHYASELARHYDPPRAIAPNSATHSATAAAEAITPTSTTPDAPTPTGPTPTAIEHKRISDDALSTTPRRHAWW